MSTLLNSGDVPADVWDYCLPVGRAAVRRPGSDLTVLTYLAMTQYVLDAVDRVARSTPEVVDPALARPCSIDWDTIGASIRKTNRVLIAEQGALGRPTAAG